MSDDLALSALDWWAEAGVDTLVDEAPRDWLAAAAPSVRTATDTAEQPGASAAAAAAPALPADLAAFRRHLLTDTAIPGAPGHRLDAAGDPGAETMVVVDMPEATDRASGALLSGETGALFDRMLAAMKLARDAVYLVPFSPARPASGRLDAAACRTLATLFRHHLALVPARRILVMGEAPIRALNGLSLAAARGAVRPIDCARGTIPAIVTLHPRLVAEKRERRAEAWADLQLFMAL